MPLFVRPQANTLSETFQPGCDPERVTVDRIRPRRLSRRNANKVVLNQGQDGFFKIALRFRNPDAGPVGPTFRRKAAEHPGRLAQDAQQRLSARRPVLPDQVLAVVVMRIFRATSRIVPRHRIQHPKINWIDHFSFIPWRAILAILSEIQDDSESEISITRKLK
jgi:hypothetical protein